MSKKDKTQINKPLSENMNDRIDVDMERLRKNHVMVATPCYGGMVGEPYLKAMTGLSILFKHYGLNFTLATLSNESLVTRARNTLMAMFLQNPSYTHLLFIDSDIDFNFGRFKFISKFFYSNCEFVILIVFFGNHSVFKDFINVLLTSWTIFVLFKKLDESFVRPVFCF